MTYEMRTALGDTHNLDHFGPFANTFDKKYFFGLPNEKVDHTSGATSDPSELLSKKIFKLWTHLKKQGQFITNIRVKISFRATSITNTGPYPP